MKRAATIWAGATALLLTCGAPAGAQEAAHAGEVVEATTLLLEKLALLGEGLGIDVPLLPRETLQTAFAEALPLLPTDDPDLSWSTGFAFDFVATRTTGALEPDDEGRTVLTDARGCLAADEVAEVVHFQRFTRGAVRGHRCVIAFAGSGSDSSWVIQSRTFAEGPSRRLTAYYAVATAVDGEGDRARRELEGRLDQNVAIGGIMADYALEMFLEKETAAPDRPAEPLAERMARLQSRLGEIAASFETLSVEPPAAEPAAD